MKKSTPDYYKKFTCIADKCPITCCQEWKIAVDPDTYRQWKKTNSPEFMNEQYKMLSTYTMCKDGARIIKLDDQHKCPFLAKDKLCRIVTAYGDSILSETCAVFPREKHTFGNYVEEMLMPCCPAVIDLWKDKLIELPDVDIIDVTSQKELFLIRNKIISLIQNDNISFEKAILESFYVILELLKSESLSIQLIEEYFAKETLKQLEAAIDDIYISWNDTWNECNELLQDLSVNYQKEGLYEQFLSKIIKMAESAECPSDDDIKQFKKAISKYDILFRNYLANEIFSDMIIPDGNIKQMVMQFQWIAIEYTAIRHSLLLEWSANGKNNIDYETVRRHIVIISRMTGYEIDDIQEYLENSFEELIWEWGYFALVIGM